MNINFRTNQGEKTGEVVKDNNKTVWVKFSYKKKISLEDAKDVFKTFVTTIKRHKIKHNVRMMEV